MACCHRGRRAGGTIVHIVTRGELNRGSAVWNVGGHWGRGRERREISFLLCLGPKMAHITSAYSPILELVT